MNELIQAMIGQGIAVLDSLRLAAMLVPTAMIGSYAGGRLPHILHRRALQLAFLLFMGTIAWFTFTTAWAAAHSHHP